MNAIKVQLTEFKFSVCSDDVPKIEHFGVRSESNGKS